MSMQSSRRVNNWLQVAANVAILGGLAMVAIQISQANDLTSVQMLDSNFSTDIDHERGLMGENPNEAIFRVLMEADPANEDFFVAERAYAALQRQIIRAIAIQRRGIDGLPADGIAMANRYIFNSRHGRLALDRTIERHEGNSNAAFSELSRILLAVRDQLDEDGPFKPEFASRIERAMANQ